MVARTPGMRSARKGGFRALCDERPEDRDDGLVERGGQDSALRERLERIEIGPPFLEPAGEFGSTGLDERAQGGQAPAAQLRLEDVTGLIGRRRRRLLGRRAEGRLALVERLAPAAQALLLLAEGSPF